MTTAERKGLFWILLCIGISILWGTNIASDRNAWVDFRAVYSGTRCLLSGHNPYNVSDLEREYQSEGGQRPLGDLNFYQAITLYVNVPTAFVFIAPFAALPWGPAHWLWMIFTSSVFAAAILLIWHSAANHSLELATILSCILAINCETIFGTGNTAGIVIGFTVIAAWCFLEGRFVWLGVLCFAISLAIKPQDPGFVWLYFVLAGGLHRKRALQSLAIVAIVGIAAFLWVSHVAPTWMHDWNANLAVINAPGGINEPGLSALTGRSAAMVVDLQAAVSIFRDNPHFYNPLSYAVCGILILLWIVRVLRSRFDVASGWYALSAAVAFTMLVTYHRPWDAKLAMLAIPACCFLWAAEAPFKKLALLITTATMLLTGDVSLALLSLIWHNLHIGISGLVPQIVALLLLRPATIVLLALGVFYLWMYLKSTEISRQNLASSSQKAKATQAAP